MSDNKRRLQQLSLLMPALAEIQMWSIATTAEYVRSIEQAIKADEQLSAANARVEEQAERLERQSKMLGNYSDAIKNAGFDPCDFTKAIHKMGDIIRACKAAGFIGPDGEARTVLGGKLPILASGEIVINGDVVYANDPVLGVVECDVDITGDRFTAGWMKPGTHQNVWTEYDLAGCYSTRQAAAAKGAN
jgi:hypothetical protein